MRTQKIKKLLALSFVSLIFVQTASAYTTYGEPDCGQWVTSKSETRKAWLIGYVSGLSAMHELNGKNNNPLGKISSPQQIYVWIDNYCQKNPLKTVGDGGIELFIELMKK